MTEIMKVAVRWQIRVLAALVCVGGGGVSVDAHAQRPEISAVVFTPGLDLSFGNQGYHGSVFTAFNVHGGGWNVYLEPKMKGPLQGDGLPKQNLEGETAWKWILQGEAYVGKVWRERRYFTQEGYRWETSRDYVGSSHDWASGTTTRHYNVQYQTASASHIPAVEATIAEAGLITNTVGFGPRFARIYHPLVGVRLIDHYDVSLNEGGTQKNWTRHNVISLHLVGPGVILPGLDPDPPLPTAKVPLGVILNYDIKLKRIMVCGLKLAHLPGYNTFFRVDLKFPLF